MALEVHNQVGPLQYPLAELIPMSTPPSSDLPSERPVWLPQWAWARLHHGQAPDAAEPDPQNSAVNLPMGMPEQRPAWLPEKLWKELRKDEVDYGRTVLL